MSSSQRERTIEPPPAGAVRWRVAEIGADGHQARLAPYVELRALADALDASFGVRGWSNRFRSFEPGGVGCELEIAGITKSAVVRSAAGHEDPAELAAGAMSQTVVLHGLPLPADPFADAWVDYDPEAGEPLYWPEAPAPVPARRSGEDGSRSGPVGAAGASSSAPDAGPAGPTQGPVADTGPRAPAGHPHAEGGAGAQIHREGQMAIERLMDRLREAGKGLDAAKLVNAYAGYASDPNAARELYARLRSLLIEGSGS